MLYVINKEVDIIVKDADVQVMLLSGRTKLAVSVSVFMLS